MKRLFTVAFLVLFSIAPGTGQRIVTAELRPSLLINRSIDARWSWSAGIDSEVIWLEKFKEQPPAVVWRPFSVNIQVGAAFQWTADINLSGGYQLSWRDLNLEINDLEHRFLQQLSLSERYGKVRLNGRLRTEQRFFKKEKFVIIHRLRTRLSLDFPLQGRQLDPGEAYVNCNSEWLFPLSLPMPLFFHENRSYAGIGRRLTGGRRLEGGLEFRTRLINLEKDRRFNLFTRLTFIL